MTQIEGHGLGSIHNNDSKGQKAHANNDFDINFDKILAELEIEENIAPKKKQKATDTKSIQQSIKPFYNPVLDGGIAGVGKNELISKERYQELHKIASKIINIQLPNL
tara:strand:+ start:560 stop:883 length:324 start_codon:yes stop_codon:yes gene_type:complete